MSWWAYYPLESAHRVHVPVPAVDVTSPGGTSISVSSFKEFSAPKVAVFFKLPNLPLRCLKRLSSPRSQEVDFFLNSHFKCM